MSTESVVARHFDAFARRDAEAMAAMWAPDGHDRVPAAAR